MFLFLSLPISLKSIHIISGEDFLKSDAQRSDTVIKTLGFGKRSLPFEFQHRSFGSLVTLGKLLHLSELHSSTRWALL